MTLTRVYRVASLLREFYPEQVDVARLVFAVTEDEMKELAADIRRHADSSDDIGVPVVILVNGLQVIVL